MRALVLLLAASLVGCPATSDDEDDGGPSDAAPDGAPIDAGRIPDGALPMDAPAVDGPAPVDSGTDAPLDTRSETDAPTSDAPAALTVSIGDLRVTESTAEATAARLPVTFSAPLPSDITLGFVVTSGTAVVGEDLYAFVLELAVPRGATSGFFEVLVAGDLLDERDEDCTVTVVTTIDSAFLTVARATATLTIVDDDEALFRLQPAERRIAEGTAASPGTTTLRLERTGASPWPGSVRVRTVPVTATTADFLPFDEVVTFPEDSTMHSEVTVALIGDTVAEVDETFRVELLDPVGGMIIPSEQSTLVTITNDDPPEISGCASRSVTEGDTGLIRFDFVLSSNVPAPAGVRASFTIGGTASRGSDYQLVGFSTMTSGVDFPVGATSARVSIDVINDTAVEINETVTLALIGASGATVSPTCTLSTLTIVEDDPF